MKKLGIVALTFCILLSSYARAGLISYHGYILDEDKNIVTGGGLDWLQWDVTLGMNIQQALDIYSAAGWRLAANTDMAKLFNVFGFGAVFIWDTDENTNQNSPNNDGDIEDITNDPEKQFVALFGNTFLTFPGNVGSADPNESSTALFADNFDGIHNINRATVYDDYLFTTDTVHTSGAAFISDMLYAADHQRSNFGIALVRASSTTNPVPEPTSLILFTLGLLGLLSTGRKFSSNANIKQNPDRLFWGHK